MGDDSNVVLVVDDDEACRDLHSHWLAEDYDVRTAASGHEALERASGTDVVLLDRQMPDVDGETVARRLRESDHECFVVMLSSVEPDFDIVDLPVDEYLTKPVSRDVVVGVVDTMVARAVCQRLLTEFFSLCARKEALERRTHSAELADSDEYRRLSADFEAKRVAVEEMIETFDGERREALLDAVSDEAAIVDDLVRA